MIRSSTFLRFFEEPANTNQQTGEETQAPATFTREEVDKLLAAEKAKATSLAKRIEELSTSKNSAEQQRTELLRTLEEYQNQNKSKEQVEIEKRQRLLNEHKEALAQREAEANLWKKKFVDTRVQTELVQAAAANGAYSTEQILGLLGGSAFVDDETGDVKINFVDVIDGKRTPVVLPVNDVFERMLSDTDRYGNLFKSGAKSGLGSNNVGGPKGKIDMATLDYKSYQENRAALSGRSTPRGK
jgi:hypothetical protein